MKEGTTMLICDTHSDTLYAMGVEHVTSPVITPERLRAGGVNMQVFALWTGTKGNQGDVEGIVAAELAQVPTMLAAGLRQVTDPAEVRPGEQTFMLSVEGGEVFEGGIDRVAMWFNRGVRMAALTWNNDNAIGFPAKGGTKTGLTPYGLQVVREMQRLGMAVDTSHLNEAGFYDLFSKTDVPPMASHSCCRALCDHCRNLTDEQLRLMIREGGYVGVNFYPYFLANDGKADVETIIRHIDHICQLGGEKIVGFGSDFDGIEVVPEGLEHPGKLNALLEGLRRRGYGEEAVAGVAGGNLADYFARIRRPS